jgi:hypothetical protein
MLVIDTEADNRAYIKLSEFRVDNVRNGVVFSWLNEAYHILRPTLRKSTMGECHPTDIRCPKLISLEGLEAV